MFVHEGFCRKISSITEVELPLLTGEKEGQVVKAFPTFIWEAPRFKFPCTREPYCTLIPSN